MHLVEILLNLVRYHHSFLYMMTAHQLRYQHKQQVQRKPNSQQQPKTTTPPQKLIIPGTIPHTGPGPNLTTLIMMRSDDYCPNITPTADSCSPQ